MDRKIMTMNAEKVFRAMKKGYQYTLAKLQEITTIGATELCMALLVLIKDQKIKQFKSKSCLIYTKIKL